MTSSLHGSAGLAAIVALGAGSYLAWQYYYAYNGDEASSRPKHDRNRKVLMHVHASGAGELAHLPVAAPPGDDAPSVRRFEEDEILSEQFTRNVTFFGVAASRSIASSFVVVVGLGVRSLFRAGSRSKMCC